MQLGASSTLRARKPRSQAFLSTSRYSASRASLLWRSSLAQPYMATYVKELEPYGFSYRAVSNLSYPPVDTPARLRDHSSRARETNDKFQNPQLFPTIRGCGTARLCAAALNEPTRVEAVGAASSALSTVSKSITERRISRRMSQHEEDLPGCSALGSCPRTSRCWLDLLADGSTPP
jgi:hypothetical protein